MAHERQVRVQNDRETAFTHRALFAQSARAAIRALGGRACFAHDSEKFARELRHVTPVAFFNRGAIEDTARGAEGDGASADPFRGIGCRDAGGRDDWNVRERAADRLQVFRTERTAGNSFTKSAPNDQAA
jgi:hypothetical protein